MTTSVAEAEQTALLDLSGKELNKLWVDENAQLFVANNPLHWRAHKYQTAIARMEKQLQTNPAQFNAAVYSQMIDKLGELMELINKGEHQNAEILDERNVAESRIDGGSAQDGAGKSISLDS